MNEMDITLQVQRLDLGVLETNARTIRAYVEREIEKYAAENYSAGNIGEAKADRALLNKTAQLLNAKRLELERKWVEPFEGFKSEVNGAIAAIKMASARIDSIVKAVEEKEKKSKEEYIRSYFDSKGYGLYARFEQIMEVRWLNRSEKMSHIEAEIDGKIGDVRRGLEAIEALGLEPVEENELKCRFMGSLDINATLRWRKERAEAMERIAKEKAEREDREREMCERAAAALAWNAPSLDKIEAGSDAVSVPIQSEQSDKRIHRFAVECTSAEAEVIGQFLTDIGLEWEEAS